MYSTFLSCSFCSAFVPSLLKADVRSELEDRLELPLLDGGGMFELAADDSSSEATEPPSMERSLSPPSDCAFLATSAATRLSLAVAPSIAAVISW